MSPNKVYCPIMKRICVVLIYTLGIKLRLNSRPKSYTNWYHGYISFKRTYTTLPSIWHPLPIPTTRAYTHMHTHIHRVNHLSSRFVVYAMEGNCERMSYRMLIPSPSYRSILFYWFSIQWFYGLLSTFLSFCAVASISIRRSEDICTIFIFIMWVFVWMFVWLHILENLQPPPQYTFTAFRFVNFTLS